MNDILAGFRQVDSALLQTLCDVESPLLLPTAAVRAVERVMIEERGVPGIVLMKRAASAVFARVQALLRLEARPLQMSSLEDASAQSVCVFCGSGNNAGDGFVVAGLALGAGLQVTAVCVGAISKLPADATRAHAWALAAGVPMCPWQSADGSLNPDALAAAEHAAVLVDALLGTGVTGAPRPDYARAFACLNTLAEGRKPVVAIDVPSGLNADTGAVAGAVVRASETITFIAVKPGLLTGRGPEFCGALSLADLAVPAALCAAATVTEAALERVAWSADQALPGRRRDAHKGDSGHVLVLGGASGMGGAAMLAAEAALRCGAGLVSVGCASEHTAAMLARRPEIMARGLDGGVYPGAVGRAAGAPDSAQEARIWAAERDLSASAGIDALLARATVIAIGPGLGQAAFGRRLLAAALGSNLPLVLDADALNLLAAGFAAWPTNAIITPHPAEAARVLGVATAVVQQDRLAAARALVQRTGAVVVLKGAGSVIADGERTRICTDGNPGMAVGGMGDVLAGVIAALRAQGCSAFDAAVRGVCLHGRAGDAAVGDGERGLLAGDLFPWLRRLSNGRSTAQRSI